MSDEDMIRRGDVLAKIHWLSDADWTVPERRAAAAITNALRAIPAAHVTVKPLEWLEIRTGQYFEARVISILYSVRLGSDGVVRWQAGHMGTWHEVNSVKAAKAAAQADYDARIRSALTAQPSPDVAALVAAHIAALSAYMKNMGSKNAGKLAERSLMAERQLIDTIAAWKDTK